MKLLKTCSVNMVDFLTETGYITPEIRRSGETKYVLLLLWTQAGAWREVASTKEGDHVQIVETDSNDIRKEEIPLLPPRIYLT